MVSYSRYVSLLIILIMSVGCEPENQDDDTIITTTPMNLGDINSVYDDYNSAAPYPSHRTEVFFSSNRNSAGKEFDFVSGKIDFLVKDDMLKFHIPNDVAPRITETIYPLINTAENEYGPYVCLMEQTLFFLYSTSPEGNSDVSFVELTRWNYDSSSQTLSSVLSITGTNSVENDAYPFIDTLNQSIYFCSNREAGRYDIFSVPYDGVLSKDALIGTNPTRVEKQTRFSSTSDDKCPYIQDNVMVFASNRPGGFGGYDIWYSKFEEDQWGPPLNCGVSINTEFDEFRPIIFEVLFYDVMIFSSDRPGGKGGFDLYISEQNFGDYYG